MEVLSLFSKAIRHAGSLNVVDQSHARREIGEDETAHAGTMKALFLEQIDEPRPPALYEGDPSRRYTRTSMQRCEFGRLLYKQARNRYEKAERVYRRCVEELRLTKRRHL